MRKFIDSGPIFDNHLKIFFFFRKVGVFQYYNEEPFDGVRRVGGSMLSDEGREKGVASRLSIIGINEKEFKNSHLS